MPRRLRQDWDDRATAAVQYLLACVGTAALRELQRWLNRLCRAVARENRLGRLRLRRLRVTWLGSGSRRSLSCGGRRVCTAPASSLRREISGMLCLIARFLPGIFSLHF